MKRIACRCVHWSVALATCACVVSPAQAQVRGVSQAREFDRVRVAGIWWVGSLDGTLGFRDLEELPPGIDVGDLALGNTESGWMGEGDFGLGRRHRLRVSGSNRLSDSTTTVRVDVDFSGIQVPVDVPISSELGIREFEANYNFLFVANDAVDAGFLAGVGYFDATAFVSTPIGEVDAALDAPFPSLGGNVLLNPSGRVRGYVELTGFPEITVDDFSGWKMSLIARVEAFITQNIGVYAGYRTYELDFEDKGVGVNVNLLWSGFTLGGAVRF